MARAACNRAFASIPVLLILSGFSTHASGKELCQDSVMTDGSRVQMCKSPSGKWYQPDVQNTARHRGDSDLPSHSEVTYDGDYTVELITYRKMNLNNLSARSLINQASNSSQSRTIGGNIRVAVNFSDSALTAVVYGRNFSREQFSGSVSNGFCRMVGTQDTFEGRCGKDKFEGVIRGKTRQGQDIKGSFRTSAVQVVDIEERDKQRLATEKARQAEVAAAEARIRNAPPAGLALTKKLEGFVLTDSRGWVSNHYDHGSVNNVKIIDGSVKNGHYTLRGEYTYNGGASGWVIVQMSGSDLECIQFHDSIMGCRDLRTPEQGQAMRQAVIDALPGPGSGSGDGGHPGRDPYDTRDVNEYYRNGCGGACQPEPR